jgi:hypothetical protein
MTDNTAMPATTSGIWRRLWSFLQACEMSTAEYHDFRIDALERRVGEMRKELQERVSAVSVAPQENSRDPRGIAIGSEVRDPQKPNIG